MGFCMHMGNAHGCLRAYPSPDESIPHSYFHVFAHVSASDLSVVRMGKGEGGYLLESGQPNRCYTTEESNTRILQLVTTNCR